MFTLKSTARRDTRNAVIATAVGTALVAGAAGLVVGDSLATNRLTDAAGGERVERPWFGLKSSAAAKKIDPDGSVAKATQAAQKAASKKTEKA